MKFADFERRARKAFEEVPEQFKEGIDGLEVSREAEPHPTLPEVYIQNASLEIAWFRVIFENRTIAGDSYVPFISEGDEGYDVNDVQDWIYAEYLVANGEATLPPISKSAFPVEA